MRSDHMGYVCAKLMLKPDLQNTEHGLDPDVLRNAGSKVVAVCCAATSSVIVPLAALQIFQRAARPRKRCGSKTPAPAERRRKRKSSSAKRPSRELDCAAAAEEQEDTNKKEAPS